MSVELFITNLDFLTKLQAVFNLDDFILNFNETLINVQEWFFFSKSINEQTKIRACRGKFFLKINKCTCTSIWYTRVHITLHCTVILNPILPRQGYFWSPWLCVTWQSPGGIELTKISCTWQFRYFSMTNSNQICSKL